MRSRAIPAAARSHALDGGTLAYLLEVAGATITPGPVEIHDLPACAQEYTISATIETRTGAAQLAIRNVGGTRPTGTPADYIVEANETTMNELDVIALVRFIHGE